MIIYLSSNFWPWEGYLSSGYARKRPVRRLQRGGLPVSPLSQILPDTRLVSVALAKGQFPKRPFRLSADGTSDYSFPVLTGTPCLQLPGLSLPYETARSLIFQSRYIISKRNHLFYIIGYSRLNTYSSISTCAVMTTGTDKSAPTIPATLSPTTSARSVTMGLTPALFCIIFGTKTYASTC